MVERVGRALGFRLSVADVCACYNPPLPIGRLPTRVPSFIIVRDVRAPIVASDASVFLHFSHRASSFLYPVIVIILGSTTPFFACAQESKGMQGL
jgi:hypothetical protein